MSPTPIHGNYHGYYTKRPFLRDPRLQLATEDDPSFFLGKHVLDIGCNEGFVTCEIAQDYGASMVVGVDIDESLIRAAWARRRKMWSLQQPPIMEHSKGKRREAEIQLSHYFPSSLSHMFGPLPIPSGDDENFPHNIVFRMSDWPVDPIHEDSSGYDIILALSLTKWIHLNSGDDGIRAFFMRVFDVMKPGGALLLEPQPWDGYSKATRISQVLKQKYNELQLRPEDFPRLLQDLGFSEPTVLGETGERGFKRPLHMYRKHL